VKAKAGERAVPEKLNFNRVTTGFSLKGEIIGTVTMFG
jgi:hypothetical protein